MKYTIITAFLVLLSCGIIAWTVYLWNKTEPVDEYCARIKKQVGLTWTCHVCGEERPDAMIGVITKPLYIEGRQVGHQNIRYCLDKPECKQGAEEFSFIKDDD